MSIFSDHESGYMDDFEYQHECRRMNRAEREYDEFDKDEEEGERIKLVDWQYCSDLNDINDAIKNRDEDWEGLTSADDIISITYDTNHGCYVVFWKMERVRG